MALSIVLPILLLPMVGCICSSGRNTNDMETLLCFKSTLNKQSARALVSWNTANNGLWKGVVWDRENVLELHLPGFNMSGKLQPLWCHLPLLTILDLSSNKFTGFTSSSSSECNVSNLQILDLSNNHFSGKFPPHFDKLTNLRELNLSTNTFTGHIPLVLFNTTTKLASLDMFHNSLYGSMPHEFGLLSELRFLYLAKNNISGGIPTSLANCTFLEDLALGSNNISGEIPVSLFKLMHLADLTITNNNLFGTIPSAISNATALRAISLDYNHLSGNIPHMTNLTNLEMLILTSNNLWGTLSFVGTLHKLAILDVRCNRISGVIANSMADLSTSLTHMILCYNDLRGSIPPWIGNFSICKGLHQRSFLICPWLEVNLQHSLFITKDYGLFTAYLYTILLMVHSPLS